MSEVQDRFKECPVTMGGGEGINLLYNISELIEAKTAVETGVAYGFSSLAFLLSVTKRGGQLYSVDHCCPK